MVELAALIVVVVFAGYVINAAAKSWGLHRQGRRIDALARKRDALPEGSAEREAMQRRIDFEIEIAEAIEKRDPNPLR